MADPILISMKEAAHRLGVSKAYLYLAVGRGDLLTVTFGKRRLVHVDDLQAFLAAHRPVRQAA